MKKFNFFQVSLLALFMIFGFDLSAQNYKPIDEAMVVTETAVSQFSAKSTSLTTNTNANTFNSATKGMRNVVGKALLNELKSSGNVGASLDKLATLVVVPAARAAYKADAISYYRTLLLQ